MVKYYTVKEVAEILRKHYRTILKWIDEDYIVATKVKDGYLISEMELDRILNSKPQIHLPE